MPRIKGISAILWPIAIVIIALSAFYFKPWQTKPAETISVTAQGKAQATPNIAKITATLTSQNPNSDEARRENAKKVGQIVESLKKLGIDQKDIKTQNISAGPGYEIQIYPRPPIASQFTTTLEITIRNFDTADEVIKTLTQNGVQNLYGPNLNLDENAQNTAKSSARENAVSLARQKAEELAKLSGRKLGKAVSIKEEGEAQFPTPLLSTNQADLKQKAAQIAPGQNEVVVNISVDFSLK